MKGSEDVVAKTLIEETQSIYDEQLDNMCKAGSGSRKKTPISSFKKEVISKTMESQMKNHPDIQPNIIWKEVHKAHLRNYIGNRIQPPNHPLESDELFDYLLDGDTLELFSSAEQSWKRSSGVGWENFIRSTFDLSDLNLEVKILSAPEMNLLLSGSTLKNREGVPSKLSLPLHDDALESEYVKFLHEILADSNFDLFLVQHMPYYDEPQWRLFGLIQCKTSIRDRLKINVKSSEEAMERNLWSILISMDADDFTKSGQYNKNAKSAWHGFYVLDNENVVDDSIYYGSFTTIQMLITNHCKQVLQALSMNTQSVHKNWRPK